MENILTDDLCLSPCTCKCCNFDSLDNWKQSKHPLSVFYTTWYFAVYINGEIRQQSEYSQIMNKLGKCQMGWFMEGNEYRKETVHI